MRISLQLVVQDDGDVPAIITEIAQFERDGLDAGSLGLHLEEAKSLLGRLQRTMVAAQVAEAVARTSVCSKCGSQLTCKGHHHLVFRSAFGRLSIDSPRLYPCRRCQGDARSFSPVARCLPERVSPELRYLEVKFAALMSYGLTVNVLQEVLPLDHVLAASSIRRQVTTLGRRLEAEQATDALQHAEVTASVGSSEIPEPSPIRAVGIDGGYLRLARHRRRQDGWFEVIVGKSLRDQDGGHSFAYVHKLERRPADRMWNFLLREGVQPSQPVTFLSDGGDTVRFAQLGFGDRGEYVLDWFHIAMRVQNLEQMIKGRPAHCDGPTNAALIKALHGAKWHLWHGCAYPALRRLESLGWDLEAEASPEEAKLLGKLEEFIVYLDNNRHFIVNYGDRYRHGEPIASGFVESAVNQVVSKRFVKRQQMAWRPRHAHNLLQIRTAVLNNQLRSYVDRWYPSIAGEEEHRLAA
ncbi:ISKra4 family transposase [Cupriavidus necator]|uniref:ISKra4 family transposase n=1 Tax=Cupriavidus necator TaxID=106590 RepID=UPI0039C177BC